MATILVTGGAGYIGSHTAVELLDAGHDVVVLDDLSNSHREAVSRVEEITGKRVSFVVAGISDAKALTEIFRRHRVDAVMHFAGYKAVGESVEKPLLYYRNNVAGTLALLETMQRHGVFQLVFSSSCTVYGEPQKVPLSEDHPRAALSPYGRTKLMIEHILEDTARSEERWSIRLLRYFNPVGAHCSGRIGEDPRGIPNNLMPYLMKVAAGQLEELSVFGGDYPTPDGTCVRDYIHVTDLARGHLAALTHLDERAGCHAYNLGTGIGTSVLDMVRAAETVIGQPVPYRMAPRRPGDVTQAWADPSRAAKELSWQAELGLDAMCRDHWQWQRLNPRGYEDSQPR